MIDAKTFWNNLRDKDVKQIIKIFLLLTLVLIILACSSSSRLDEQKVNAAVNQFVKTSLLPTRWEPSASDIKVVKIGPIMGEGDTRTVHFEVSYKWSGRTNIDGHTAVIRKSQDGKWYLTDVQQGTHGSTWRGVNMEIK